MTDLIKLQWVARDGYEEAVVPATDHNSNGQYLFVIEPRPLHCDRGRFIALVFSMGVGPLDGQEGFPRYYFDLNVAKSELEAWANDREEIKNAVKK